MNKIFLSLLGLIVCVCLTAQDIIISTDSTATPELDLMEVVVSASKNNSQLKKLPASVSIFNERLVEEQQINTLDEVTGLCAGFVMPDYGSKLTSPVYIRGIGSKINSPSVGLYVDGVPYFEKAAFNFDFYDVERIEILKGPQGTLYGRNSMGGLINIETLSPLEFQGTKLKLTAADYGLYKVNVGHYQKVNDRLAFSLSGNYKHFDGFYNNDTLKEKVDGLNSLALKTKLIYQPNKYLTVMNTASIDNSEEGGYPYSVYDDSLDVLSDISYNQQSTYDRMMFSDGLRFSYDKNGRVLDGVVAYQLIDDDQGIDQDFSPDSTYYFIQKMEQNMLSGEFIFRSGQSDKFEWVFGVFGFKQWFDKSVDGNFYKYSKWYLKEYDLQVRSLGWFHQSTFRPIKNLDIVVGLRQEYEKSSLDFGYEEKRGGNYTVEDSTANFNHLYDDIILPKLALDYQFLNTSVYLSYTKGYKPGGYNSSFDEEDQVTFKNETSDNFEFGVKSALLHKNIFVDFAVFYTKLNDQQIYRTLSAGSYLDNAGLSENKGAEISLSTRPYYGFQLNGSFGYIDSKILEYEKSSTLNYNNNTTPYIPEYTLGVSVSKTFYFPDIACIDELTCNVVYKRLGESYWDLGNKFKEDPYGVLDGRIAYQFNKFNVGLWAKNILDEGYKSYLFEFAGKAYAQPSKPFQCGVSLGVTFN